MDSQKGQVTLFNIQEVIVKLVVGRSATACLPLPFHCPVETGFGKPEESERNDGFQKGRQEKNRPVLILENGPLIDYQMIWK